MAKLGDYADFIMGQAPASSECNTDGKGTPFVKAGQFGVSIPVVDEWTTNPLKMADDTDVLICVVGATSGKLNRGIKCAIGRSVAAIRPHRNVVRDYIYYGLHPWIQRLRGGSQGSAIGVITKDMLDSVDMAFPTIEKQEEIVQTLSLLEGIIEKRKQEIEKMDQLIKARFVEMFGDPIINSEKLPTMPMTDVCEIIDGDRGKNYPTADEFSDEGYCLFLNAKNVTASGFNFDNCMFVSKEKDEALRKGKLSRGDVVLTTRGTLGNLAFYTDEIPFENIRINSGMVILRMRQDVLDEVYFIEQFKMQLDDIKEKIASGSAQPQLPIYTMNKIQVLIPDIERQKVFSEFVKQVDKSKFVSN